MQRERRGHFVLFIPPNTIIAATSLNVTFTLEEPETLLISFGAQILIAKGETANCH